MSEIEKMNEEFWPELKDMVQPEKHESIQTSPQGTGLEKGSVKQTALQNFLQVAGMRLAIGMIVLALLLLFLWQFSSGEKRSQGGPVVGTATPTLSQPVVSFSQPTLLPLAIGTLEAVPEATADPALTGRQEVILYTVQPLESIFSIAEKFGLKPETVFWSNRYTLGQTPEGLMVGEKLYILPVDGVYHMWSQGEGLNGVSRGYQVTPDVIIDYPLNNLDRATLGDLSLPNIEPGTMLVVPGGRLEPVVWVIPRNNPEAVKSFLGDYACKVSGGPVGTGSWVIPTTEHWLSGFDWNPPIHNGVDYAGRSGNLIFAADAGVVVYSGWSDRGYGNLIVIDHGNGWQTFYAHLLARDMIPCGSSVYAGQQIGLMGSTGKSTGPHLHFEMRLDGHAYDPNSFGLVSPK
ncbi:MAG: LysM peptidoglycan-binding domain-containing M23 family metallopeptidase [Anaerolineaceae bacterium]|jgi:hypothetical protein